MEEGLLWGVCIAQVYWYLIWWQCCGARAEIISFGSVRPRLRIVLYDTLKIGYFDLTNRIKIVTIYKNFFSGHDFFCQISSSSVIFRKEPEPELEPEPQFVISAPAPAPQPWILFIFFVLIIHAFITHLLLLSLPSVPVQYISYTGSKFLSVTQA
jgi:hypothetical protein